MSRHRVAACIVVGTSLLLQSSLVPADSSEVAAKVAAVESRVIAWRRDIHQHPELGNREVRTSALVAEHLRALGLEVRTGIAKTGVIAVLKGAHPGGVVALRADMDALPVEEQTNLPFASRATAEYDGKTVPVMHACGHDAHTAMLMGAAEVLTGMRAQIAGTILFVFQPAEEGPPRGEEGGAALMLAEGALDHPRPDAMFALHVEPGLPGRIDVRPGPLLSSATGLRINLKGRQTHAGRPWEGTDLINLTADVIKAVTTISARQVNVLEFPNVVTIATVQAGVRGNILPGDATMQGTIRTFSAERLQASQELIRANVNALAGNYGATATVQFEEVARVTENDPRILDVILPALREAAGGAGVNTSALLRGAAEDFSYFQRDIPGVYYILGSTRDYTTKEAAPSNHSPHFDIDEAVLAVGVKAHVLAALRYLSAPPIKTNASAAR
jgi:amidohydrolase